MGLIMEAHTTGRAIKHMVEWLAETFVKRWLIEKELEMPYSPWLSVDKYILGFEEIAMLEWVHCVKPNPP